MSQLSYHINQDEAFAGMKADSRFDTVESKIAEGSIPFGFGVVSGVNDAVNQVRDPAKCKAVATGNIDLVSGNVAVATVNGTAMTGDTFATTHAALMTAIAAKIAANAAVESAEVTASRAVTVMSLNGEPITLAIGVTGGTTQSEFAVVLSDPGVFRGIAAHRHVEPVAGVSQYVDQDSVDVVRKGQVWMPHTAAASPSVDDDLYIELATAAEAGKATDVSSNNIATGGKIRAVDSTNKLVKAEINLP